MMIDITDLVDTFHTRKFGEGFGEGTEDCSLRIRLHNDEHEELIEALTAYGTDIDNRLARLVLIAQELADVVYVAYGTAQSLGIPLDRVIEIVHRSNMTRTPENPGMTGTQKMIKGPGYVQPLPEILAVIYEAMRAE